MDLTRFDPAADGDLVRECHEVYLTGAPTDDPVTPPMGLRCFAGWLALGWTEDPSETWLVRDDSGTACGWYRLTLPERENRHLAELHPVVPASRRRAGLGRTLARHAAARARQHGRTLLTGDARRGSPGAAFADALGARHGVTEVRRVLELGAVPDGRLATLREKAASVADGYSLLSWEGTVPEGRLAEVAAVVAATADMPREPGREAQRWDAERVRQGNRRMAMQGMRSYTVAARSVATGELTGLSQLSVDPADPDWGFQELTAVTRQHRGHRLGLLMKVAMLELLAEREPQLARVLTGNADENRHMIAINAELGFTVLDRWPSFELEVAQVW